MPTLHWLTREQDLEAAARAEYRAAEREQMFGGVLKVSP
jgi:hypothetical protein